MTLTLIEGGKRSSALTDLRAQAAMEFASEAALTAVHFGCDPVELLSEITQSLGLPRSLAQAPLTLTRTFLNGDLE